VFFLFFLLTTSLMAGLVMVLWNAILPDITAAKEIHFGQALGLLILFRVLTGAMPWRRANPYWRRSSPLRDRWMKMSEEERDQFREQLRRRCSGRNP
jgi:hypothetical protein